MLPSERAEAEAHEHILADDERSHRRMNQARIPHAGSKTNHEGLVSNRIDERAQPTALVEVSSNVAIAEIQSATYYEC